MKTIKISRRDFVGKALAGGALLVAYPWLGVLADNSFSDYSRKIRIGVIGVGSRGLLLLHYLTELSGKINIEVIAVCDNYEPHYQRAVKKTDGKAKAFYDYKKLLDIKEIDAVIIATADHSTPSSGPLIHSGESVPIMFHGRGVRRDRVRQFDEISAASGALGSLRGKELIYMVLNHLDRSKLHGIMDTPVDQPYWPGKYNSFKLE